MSKNAEIENSAFKTNTDIRKSRDQQENRNTSVIVKNTESESPKKKNRTNDPPLTINILYTQYEIMEEVA